MSINQEMKNKLIQLYCNTHRGATSILREVAPNGEITFEDFYQILEDYEKENNKIINRAKRRPKLKTNNLAADDSSVSENVEEIVYNLREKGIPYNEICTALKNKGINMHFYDVKDICEKIYSELNREIPDTIYWKEIKQKRESIPEQQIYELRKKGLTYKHIKEEVDKMGCELSYSVIRKVCKKIFAEKDEVEPNVKDRLEQVNFDKLKGEIGDEVFLLREEGYTYEKMKKYFENKNVKVPSSRLIQICIEMYNEKGKKNPKLSRKIDLSKIDSKRIKKALEKVKQTKNASDAQLEEILKSYNLDIDKENEHDR